MLPPIIHSIKSDVLHMAPGGWNSKIALITASRRPTIIPLAHSTFILCYKKDDAAYNNQ